MPSATSPLTAATSAASPFDPTPIVAFIQTRLTALADPANAAAMASYLKTDMACYGVKTPDRRAIFKAAVHRFPVGSLTEYEAAVLALWALPHREEKYAAIEYARGFKRFQVVAALPLYERLIVEGAWWDLVDGVAPYLVGPMLAKWPARVRPILDRWVAAEDQWLRRSALICQYRLKARTDGELLLRYCLLRAPDPEFWVRKAIGWALREYSKVAPEAVRDFLLAHKTELSPLSFKEGAKRLAKTGVAPFG